MFQGQSFSIQQIDKNRFSFKSAYTQRAGTLTEIQRVVCEHADEARRGSIELALIKQKLRSLTGDGKIAAASVSGTKFAEAGSVALESKPSAVEPVSPAPTPLLALVPEPKAAEPKPMATKSVERMSTPKQPRAMARHLAANKAKVAPANHVEVVEASRAPVKRRPYGMSYLNVLRAAEALEKAR
jgi:hypothetical protein